MERLAGSIWKLRSDGGFTIIEIIVVLVLIGIFTAVAVIQHANTDPTLLAQSQVLESHIRYIQMRSMNSDTSLGLHFDPNGTYYELYAGNIADVISIPGISEKRLSLGEMGITVQWAIEKGPGLSSTEFQLSFDSWGRPYLNDVLAAGDITIRLTQNGGIARQLLVRKNTGFVQSMLPG